MTNNKNFEVIIIGGSYAGLSAAMTLGRSLRNVLIIDSGEPCNSQTPYSHNFITQDGETPAAIAARAREQVLKYDTITFQKGLVREGRQLNDGFEIISGNDEVFLGSKLLFATGLTDSLFPVEGFSECWGISILHCPYCHGYEVKGEKTGILANGDTAFDFAKLISNWTNNLTVFTQGESTLNEEQRRALRLLGTTVVEKEILRFVQNQGKVSQLEFADGSKQEISAIYARPPLSQHCPVPELLGCELTDNGFIKLDNLQRTTVPGVYAAGDNSSPMRAVAAAVAAGNMAGAAINTALIDDRFKALL